MTKLSTPMSLFEALTVPTQQIVDHMRSSLALSVNRRDARGDNR